MAPCDRDYFLGNRFVTEPAARLNKTNAVKLAKDIPENENARKMKNGNFNKDIAGFHALTLKIEEPGTLRQWNKIWLLSKI